MRLLNRFKRIIIVFIAILGITIGVGGVAFAEDTPDYRIQVSPAALQLDLTPGNVTDSSFEVQNTGKKSFKYELSVTPYSVVDEDYKQDFESETAYNDIVNWITFSETSGKVEPGGTSKVSVKVKVPTDVPAGGQYAVVMVKMVNDNASSGGSAVTAEKQIGLIVYSEVDGNTRKTGSIIENKVPGFMFAPPVRVNSVVENTGNVHVRAQYILQVYPLFGDEEVYTNEEQPDTKIILPETRRLNTISWDGAPQLGIFRVKQTVKFLDEENVVEKIVFICPLWFLFIVLAVVFLAIFWIVSRIRGRGKE